MRRIYVMFLQAVIILVGIGALAFLLWEPHMEGVNANATSLREIYFDDPFLIYMYLGSVPFLVALYQGFKLLNHVREGEAFSERAVGALVKIRSCAFVTAGAILAADAFLVIHARLYPEMGAVDGPEGAIVVGLAAAFVSVVVGSVAVVWGRVLRNAADMKSENDLTI